MRKAEFASNVWQWLVPQGLPFLQASQDLIAPLHYDAGQSLTQMQCEIDCGWLLQFEPLWHFLGVMLYLTILSMRHQHLLLIHMELHSNRVIQPLLFPSLNLHLLLI